jgi:hypothetical protein
MAIQLLLDVAKTLRTGMVKCHVWWIIGGVLYIFFCYK